MCTESNDTYKTLKHPSEEVLFKDRKSKFYGYAFPLTSEAEVAPLLESLRKKHRSASHVCYAWQLGPDGEHHRANDDGEPSYSAGMPILGQLQSFGVTQVLLAVVRIYGGTKLGVGGLVNAYRTTARMALEASDIVLQIQREFYAITCSYAAMSKVLKILKRHGISIHSREMQIKCVLRVAVRKQHVPQLLKIFQTMPEVAMTPI